MKKNLTHAETKRLFANFEQLYNRIIGDQRDFYLRYYTESVKAQKAYWNTWLKQKEMAESYYWKESKPEIAVFQGAVDAFLTVPKANEETRVTGILKVFAFGRKFVPMGETERFFTGLAKHEDPLLKLIAHKTLMRTTLTVEYAASTVEVFMRNFPYGHPYRQIEYVQIVADFMKPAFHRLALSKPDAMAAQGKLLFAPMIENHDLVRLVAWRQVFWPYINCLEKDRQVEEAEKIILDVIDILDKGDYWLVSGAAKKFRAELDLKLVRMGRKPKADSSLGEYFNYAKEASFWHLRPELEAPRPDGPIDMSGFNVLTFPRAHQGIMRGTGTKSKTFETFKNGIASSGVAHQSVGKWEFDAEGNELYTFTSVGAEQERVKYDSVWDEYDIQKMDTRLRLGYSRPPALQEGGKTFRPSKTYLVDGNTVYYLHNNHKEGSFVITAFAQDLFKTYESKFMGKIELPAGGDAPGYVTSLAIGPRALYAGTPYGLAVFSKPGATDIDAETTARIIWDVERYNYAGEMPDRFSAPPRDEAEVPTRKVEFLTGEQGLAGSSILSLAHAGGQLIIGSGPAETKHTGLVGTSGLFIYDPESGKSTLAASTRALEKRNPLDQGEPYQITSILVDEIKENAYLSIAGNPQRNGIWRYSLKDGTFCHLIAEDHSVNEMAFDGDILVYAVSKTGLVSFDPWARTKKWIMGFVPSEMSENQAPVPPKGYEGEPLFGNPESHLWPFAADNERIFTISRDRFDIQMHRRGQTPAEKSMFSDDEATVSAKTGLFRNEKGIWFTTSKSEVYLMRRKGAP